MKKFDVHYCASSVYNYVSYAKRGHSYDYSDSYDPDNYAYCDSRENIERYLSRGSLESLL